MARSNCWRFQRFSDMARELANVTAGISEYFGAATGDRSYRVTWKPIAGTYGATDVKNKVVTLHPGLLTERCPTAPFDDDTVDMMQAIAAHEAGHAALERARSGRPATFYCRNYVINVVEDLMIDGPAFAAFNPGLAGETSRLRTEMAKRFLAPTLDAWRNGPTPCPDGQSLLSLWAVARLYGAKLPRVSRRKFEQDFVDLMDVVGDELQALDDFAGYRGQMTREQALKQLETIIQNYDRRAPQQEQKPGKQPPIDDGEQSGEGDEGDGSDSGEGDEDPEADEQQGSDGDGDDEADDDEADDDGGSDDGDSDDDDDGETGTEGGSRADDNGTERINTPGGGEADDEGEQDAETESAGEADGNGGDGDEAGDEADAEGNEGGESSDGGSAESDGPGGKASTKQDWADRMNPEVCPSTPKDPTGDPLGGQDRDFWREVSSALEALDVIASKAEPRGKDLLRELTDKQTVAAVRRAYEELASEPTRSRRQDSGRVDRHSLHRATHEDDVFTRNKDRQMSGQIVVLLDLSGSVGGYDELAKATAASLYEAMRTTEVDVWVYSYGKPTCVQLATPREVKNAFVQARSGGGTPTGAAFHTVLQQVTPKRNEVNVLFHVTDGGADDMATALKAMEEAGKRGWKVVNVAVRIPKLPYGDVSHSMQYLTDYRALPKLVVRMVKDLMKAHKQSL